MVLARTVQNTVGCRLLLMTPIQARRPMLRLRMICLMEPSLYLLKQEEKFSFIVVLQNLSGTLFKG